ncbi:hypothetical protein BZA05DRAFT_27715 [Tricharina praecox]|uniref:uncharacterized protein n=1 Tax=Tricharina praecox TaxID=43433 RepID=UPI0022205F94|nr:uncharacterized protein BZA05DRAFT_27715 [Tricharina praecox]KAI5853396.1 hypothetical protein BZA05DRAFT_27715 [Tricharina praecox]
MGSPPYVPLPLHSLLPSLAPAAPSHQPIPIQPSHHPTHPRTPHPHTNPPTNQPSLQSNSPYRYRYRYQYVVCKTPTCLSCYIHTVHTLCRALRSTALTSDVLVTTYLHISFLPYLTPYTTIFRTHRDPGRITTNKSHIVARAGRKTVSLIAHRTRSYQISD